jgi:hypothetical protein
VHYCEPSTRWKPKSNAVKGSNASAFTSCAPRSRYRLVRSRRTHLDDGPVVEKIRNATGFFGFDARTKDYADLDERGIIDPTKVVRIALQNAVAVAGVLLLAEATMIEVEEEPP